MLYQFNLWFAERLVVDIPANQFEHQPMPKINPPAWILGHLAIATDFTLQLLGQSRACPEAWHQRFGLGSTNTTEQRFPLKEELWSTFYAGHQRVITAARNASSELLASPNPIQVEFLRSRLPTIGDQVAHLMTVHESSHLGQLSAWRRMMGLPGVLA